MKAHQELSPITIATCNDDRPISTTTVAQRRGDPHAEFLLSELEWATLCRANDLSDDIVSTNGRAICRIDGIGRIHSRLLMHPDDLMWPCAELSVPIPLGAAGLRVGDWMPFPVEDGFSEHHVGVEGVGLRFLDEDLLWRRTGIAASASFRA